MATLEELEARIQHLEYRFSLLANLGDHNSLEGRILQGGLTEQQVSAVHDLIEKTRSDIQNDRGPSRNEFEKALNDIKPLQPTDDRELMSWRSHAGGLAEYLLSRRRNSDLWDYLSHLGVKF